MIRLEFEDASKFYGKTAALKSLTMRCPGGTSLCLVGPNGSGKSTTLALGAGLLSPSSGKVRWAGISGPKNQVVDFGYLPQDSRFPQRLTVEETIRFCAQARGATQTQVDEILEATGIAPAWGRFMGELSGGWVRRVGLAWALMKPSDYYLLDEPFVGLDPTTLDAILQYLSRRLEEGAGVLIASHEFEVVDHLSPGLVVLAEGKVAGQTDGPCFRSREFYERTLRIESSSESLRRIS
jgi:ABC-type multidrug transport system ATPase subunit